MILSRKLIAAYWCVVFQETCKPVTRTILTHHRWFRSDRRNSATCGVGNGCRQV